MFDPYSPVFYVLIMGLMLCVVSLPCFKGADLPPSPHADRVDTLDGLRGILASSVFLHHLAINYGYVKGSAWDIPPSGFYTMAGQAAVDLFFMITAFLFWSRLIDKRGYPGWICLYTGRLFRILPVYLAVVGPAMFLAMAYGHFQLNIPLRTFAMQVARWLSGEILEQFEFNNLGHYRNEMGMVWTLHCEWLFYLALLPLSLIARLGRFHLPITTFVFAISLFLLSRIDCNGLPNRHAFITLFLCGMMAASLKAKGIIPEASQAVLSTLTLCMILATLFLLPSGYTVLPIILLGVAFHTIVSGSTLFGLLTSRPVRRLGDISYGIYLGQGLVMFVVFDTRPIVAYANLGILHFWFVAALCAALTVPLALLLHNFVERPGIAAGKRVNGWVSDRLVRPSLA